MSRRTMICALLLAAAMCTSASAAITAFWQPVTITPEAIADDPALVNMQCWDLMTTTTGNWANGFLEALLSPGSLFYKHPQAGLTRPDPTLFEASPSREFSTYVTAPSDDGRNQTTIVLGGHPQGSPPSVGDIDGRFSMAWTDFMIVDPPGTHEIARLTFALGLLPVLGPSNVVQLTPPADAPIPDMPEPSAAAGLLACLLSGHRRL